MAIRSSKLRRLKSNRFSKPQLAIFIIAFGLIGYLIIKSFAAPNPNLAGDLNGDNTVGITDLSILLSNYGTTNSAADINNDGSVNIVDLSILLSNYGQTYTSPASGQMFMTTSELMAKPTTGAGWTYLKSQADATWGTVCLSDQNSTVQTQVLAAALVYARTGDTTYQTKVINAIKQAPGTELNNACSSSNQLLNLARTLYGYVVAADLVQMPQSTICNNGETWLTFLQRIRTTTIPPNSRWPTLEVTSADTSGNWGAYALSSHLAVSYALNDSTAITRDENIFKRYLGDTSSPAAAFNPTASYVYNSNGTTWDSTPTLQRGINPADGTKAPNAEIEDALRLTSGGSDSVPCCTVQPDGVSYQEENFDGAFSTMQLLKAHGLDLTSFQNSAMKRAFDFYMSNGGPSSFSIRRYEPYVANYWYGSAYSTASGDSISRHLGYGGWLYTTP